MGAINDTVAWVAFLFFGASIAFSNWELSVKLFFGGILFLIISICIKEE